MAGAGAALLFVAPCRLVDTPALRAGGGKRPDPPLASGVTVATGGGVVTLGAVRFVISAEIT